MTPDDARQKAREIALAHTESAVERYDLSHGGSSPLEDAITAALLSAAGQWQTMESATVSGDEFLAIDADGNQSVVFLSWEEDGQRYYRPHGSPARCDWVAWRPLPSPPETPETSMDESA